MRLIDADALIKDIDYSADMGGALGKVVECVKYYVKYMIASAPTIEERKTGKWIYDENGMDWNLGAWVCSECHCKNDNIPPAIKYNDGYRKMGNPYIWQGSKFCPNCGASMSEGEQDEDQGKDL